MNTQQMIIQEWRNLRKDRRLFAILLLLPLGYMLLFGTLYSQDKVRHIPILYLDEDHSVLSEQILQGIATSETFQLVGNANSEKELLSKVNSGEANAAIIIPDQFSKKVTQKKQGQVMTIIDGSNLIIANRVLSGVNEVVQTFSQGITIKKLEAGGVDPNQRTAIHMGYRLLFNPGSSYSVYLLLGLMGTVLQSVTMLGMTLSLTGDKEQGEKAPQRSGKYLFTKAVPYFLMGMLNVFVVAGVLVKLFHIPFVGLMGLLFLLATAFVLSLLGFSCLVAMVTKTKVQATQLTMLLIYPSFFLSGFTWPFSAMPQWVSVVGHLLPVSYFLHGIRELAIKGNGWPQMATDIYALLSFACFTLLFALVTLSFEGRKQHHGI